MAASGKLYLKMADASLKTMCVGSGAGGSSSSTSSGGKYVADGRLTLTTATPITTSDVTAATTLYYTPYGGDQIGLYDGSTDWTAITFVELSLDISAYTADKNYDIWIYNNSGTAVMESTVWTDDSTRATALATQNGVYVKTGDTTRRYVGTIRITAVTGQCEDSETSRYVWNMYNRANRSIYKTITSSHTYTSGTVRPWNNDATNKISFVFGVGDTIFCGITGTVSAGGIGKNAYISLEADTLAGWASDKHYSILANYNTGFMSGGGIGVKLIGVGYHFITALEAGDNTAAATFGWYAILGYING